MAQIWLTYEEMGSLFGRTADAAREQAIDAGWSRRRCSDGLTRVKMSGGSAHHYMINYAAAFEAVVLRQAAAVTDEVAAAVPFGDRDEAAAANPVHRMHRKVATLGDEIVKKRVPRERDWPEPSFATDDGRRQAKWANAMRRVFG